MNDPLDALREPIRPTAPDPRFAARLRAQLERAVLDPQEEPVTVTAEPAAADAPPATALALHALTPYLAVVDARAAVGFYVDAFGARRRDEPIVMPDGKVGHVEVALGDSVLMLADEFPELGLEAPVARGGPSQSLRLEVADPDAVVARAVALGATLERPVADSPYGRGGVVVDTSGHRWMVSRAPTGPRSGDAGYLSVWTRDVERAERFYRAVLGWETAPGSAGQGRQVTNLAAPLGLWGGQEPTLFACWAVPDVDRAVEIVRAAGGTAGEPRDEPYGRIADCVDDQGLPLAVFAAPGGGGGAPAPPRPGEVAYVELRVPDAGRARAFYGTVLGWGFAPGRAPGYWNGLVGATRTHPRIGISGGHGTATAMPTFAVADLPAALAALRQAGGTAAEPVRQAYGLIADAVDDQGAEFRLLAR